MLSAELRVQVTHYGVEVSGLQRISEHVYWLPPAKPDRPSVCAVVGKHSTLMLDAGASDAHARVFLDALAAGASHRRSRSCSHTPTGITSSARSRWARP